MLFSSITFLFLFFPVMLVLYYVLPDRCRNFVLFVFSLVFYAWGEPVYVLLMLYSILLNYGMGILMAKERKHKKAILVFTVLVNLFLLGFFKYYGFLMENINSLFGCSLPVRKLALPIGISFYTFQALSYIIDLYRGKFRVQKNLISFGTYITMFPQLIAGPIVRYEDIALQLKRRTVSLARFGRGVMRFVFGLAKKVLLANLTGALFDTLHASVGQASVVSAWLSAIAYTFQIYFDFSGYSDMAIGLGDMFGFTFTENFNFPYFAKNVTDFWRRWHISLGTWFKEYVYIPLGGNRVSTVRHIFNILIVWMLTGLWHGASWNFVLWGLYYGVLLLLEKYLFQRLPLPGFITRLFTGVFVILGWVIFSSDSLSQIFLSMKDMFGFSGQPFVDNTALYYLSSYGILLILCIFFSMPIERRGMVVLQKGKAGRFVLGLFTLLLLGLCIVFLVTENYNPFLYFRF